MDPLTVATILKAITLGADLVTNGLAAYNANKDAFSSQDQAVIDAAIAQVSSANDQKAKDALAALDAAAQT